MTSVSGESHFPSPHHTDSESSPGGISFVSVITNAVQVLLLLCTSVHWAYTAYRWTSWSPGVSCRYSVAPPWPMHWSMGLKSQWFTRSEQKWGPCTRQSLCLHFIDSLESQAPLLLPRSKSVPCKNKSFTLSRIETWAHGLSLGKIIEVTSHQPILSLFVSTSTCLYNLFSPLKPKLRHLHTVDLMSFKPCLRILSKHCCILAPVQPQLKLVAPVFLQSCCSWHYILFSHLVNSSNLFVGHQGSNEKKQKGDMLLVLPRVLVSKTCCRRLLSRTVPGDVKD